MYNETYLTIDDEMELEDAGLDIDELAEMDWDDRYDAIDEAGLNPLDYEYGFLDDDQSVVVSKKEEAPKCSTVGYPNTSKIRVKKMSRRERRKMEKAINQAIEDVAMDMLIFAEVFADD